MTIVLDARCVSDTISGIDRYVLGLIDGLADVNTSHTIMVLCRDPKTLRGLIAPSRHIQFEECRVPVWSLQSQVALPGVLRRLGCRVYHCPYLYAPLRLPGMVKVITVHDLIPTVYRAGVRGSWKAMAGPAWNWWSRQQCRRADAIVTVSDFTRQTLLKTFSIEPDRVRRIYNGVNMPATLRDHKPLAEAEVRRRFKIEGRVILTISRHDPYKNLVMLVRSYADVVQQLTEPCTLVIGGKVDARYPEAKQEAQSLGIADRVVFTDYIDEPTRAALLNCASVFVFPSKYEGFGLPPLEAMAAGVPVVASNTTSLPEVLGDAAIFINPDDARSLAAGILCVLNKPEIAEECRRKGVANAAQFTWKQCAQEHLHVYEELLGESPRD